MKAAVPLVLAVLSLAVAPTAGSRQFPGPPPTATFSAEACVDVNGGVLATATWSNARLRQIQFWAYGPGGFYLGEALVAPSFDERNGTRTVHWVPLLTILNGIPAETLQVNFYDDKDRWTEVVYPVSAGACA